MECLCGKWQESSLSKCTLCDDYVVSFALAFHVFWQHFEGSLGVGLELFSLIYWHILLKLALSIN